MLQYVFAALLVVFSAVHLYHSWKDDSQKRRYTKPFLLLFIAVYYIAASSAPSALLVVALIASWLGDVLLIPHGNGWFTAGGISFMVTHALFIVVYAGQVAFSSKLLLWSVPAAIVYYGISAVIIHNLKPSTPKMMLIPMYFYLLCNSTMNIFALLQLVSCPSAASVTAFAGAVLFFISDCTLFLVRYHRNKDLIFKKHFTVMLTYIAGEFLIAQGMLMILG